MKFHKLKSNIFKILDKLPNKIGYYIYHQLQKKSFLKIEDKIYANQNSYEKIKYILRKNDLSLENNNILEIGSGWLPLMPYILKINENINIIYTYDINKHYNNKRILMVHSYFKTHDFELKKSNGLYLPDFIKYNPKQNLVNSKLPKNVKLYFSRFVLEHVTPEDLDNMHRKLFDHMEEDAAILHLISPSDHRAYSDSSLSYYDFLKYSQSEWDNIQTKFDYHNRLRLPQYIDIFEKIGFKILYLEYDKVSNNSKKYEDYKKLKIHSDYVKFNEEQLLAGSINILLRKPAATKK
ncbi:hypothetical protein [Confluentibacter flavum]|uniref:Methyltransferase n=1 Tax=Confluentibacter flavum TaxID=1909700 RepID=A0A2N3HPA2_9FLAO|nr:hypothetical protein [Confluentibacter flavum]PKQ46678.1 hypothetical protein CSW08_01380 [Confluentibacter flavum]